MASFGYTITRSFASIPISPSNEYASANTRIHQDIKGGADKGLVRPFLSEAVRFRTPRCGQEEMESVEKRAPRFVAGNYNNC